MITRQISDRVRRETAGVRSVWEVATIPGGRSRERGNHEAAKCARLVPTKQPRRKAMMEWTSRWKHHFCRFGRTGIDPAWCTLRRHSSHALQFPLPRRHRPEHGNRSRRSPLLSLLPLSAEEQWRSKGRGKPENISPVDYTSHACRCSSRNLAKQPVIRPGVPFRHSAISINIAN